ncbi:RNA-binding domain-containing protein [Phellopilus nigrolimitatus]|nr:RNA-binding domain-containing protein [Phellopilus nigrolimitatus]
MARRLYLGKLPSDTRTEDVSKMFDAFGRVVDVRVMTGFGFVEYESSRDAEDAVRDLNGRSFLGANIVVEFAKENRGRRGDYDAPERGFPPRRRPAGIRITVDNISRDTSWQDLKDFGREAGSVSFADIDRDVPGRGILEYLSREDAERAVKQLDSKELRGQAVLVTFAEDRGGPDNFRRDDGYRGDRYSRNDHDDRYSGRDRYDREDRYREERPRRGRSISPLPRRDDRARSPREDRKSARDDPYEKPYERRSDRKREERFEDRPSRADAGWSRS